MTRLVLCLALVAALIVLPGRAQAPASDWVAVDPVCRDIVRSAARIDERSGANCSPALRLAGLIAPLPAPTRKAEPADHG